MNTIEEQLWNYIDGSCTAGEKLAVEAELANNVQYHHTYLELMAVHAELQQLELEEPSLSFTRNVMEQVKLELPPVALKTKVDHRIIYGIGAFFVLSLLGILGYVIASSKLDFNFSMPKMDFTLDTHKLTSSISIQVFVLFDALLVLICLDGLLRRGKISAQKKES